MLIKKIRFIFLSLAGLFFVFSFSGCSGCNNNAERVEVTTLNFPDNKLQGNVSFTQAFENISVGSPSLVLLTAPNDNTDRIFLVDRGGRIFVFENDDDATSVTTFLNLIAFVDVNNEQGLLGLAFDPNYSINGYFYVFYNFEDSGDYYSRISRFTVSADPNVADPGSELILFEVPQPATNHKGGMLAFGPDGYLYISVGDGGSTPEVAQDMTNLRGKILRIDVNGATMGDPYDIPADNPFVGDGGGVREEIWAYGFRNPWRMSFDRSSGELWVGDVGQDLWEEIDIIEAGGNYGWQNFEGNHEYNNFPEINFSTTKAPIWEYSHNGGSASITGGYVYRGTKVPSLLGKYIYADYVSGTVQALTVSGGDISSTEIGSIPGVTGFGEDASGEIYLVTSSGEIYRIEESENDSDNFPKKLSDTGIFKDLKTLEVNPGILEYDLNHPFWSDGLVKKRWLALPGLKQITLSNDEDFVFPEGTVLIKHFDWDLGDGETRRIETRVFVYHDDGWAGYTYEWNNSQTEATLISEGKTLHLTEGSKTLNWPLPSRGQCMGCHTPGAKFALGLEISQINRELDGVGNQLDYFNELNLFESSLDSSDTYNVYPGRDDETVSVETRARAYLHTNCSSCHRPGENELVGIDFRFSTPLNDMNIKNINPTRGNLGVSNAKRLFPGNKNKSIIYLRMTDPDHRMPPYGSKKIDTKGADLVGDWINDL